MHPTADKTKIITSLGYLVRYPNTAFFRKRGLAGKPHRGIDFAPKKEFRGTPLFILAPVTGEVVFAGYHTQYGNMIVIKSIEHGVEYLHMMCHLRSISNQVQFGKRVIKGTIIGLMGKTGTATGDHLHYQVERKMDRPRQTHPWIKGYWKFINPKAYLT